MSNKLEVRSKVDADQPAPTKMVLRDSSLLSKLQAQISKTSAPSIQPEAVLLVLDASYSIYRSWEPLRKAVDTLLECSAPELSQIGVVLFSDGADIFCPFSREFGKVSASLPEICPGGATAMKKALALAATMKWPTGPKRVILLSDGAPTDGDPLAEAVALYESGVIIDTVGCGDADEETLMAIAAAGHGRYVACGQIGELKRVFRSLETKVRFLLGPGK